MATPQSVEITIGGVDRTALCSDVSYRCALNGGADASFTVADASGAYVPAEDAVVEIRVGGTLRWAGEIAEAEVTFLGATGGVSTRVTAHDHAHRATRGLLNAILPSQSLKASLQYLTNTGGALQLQGITLAAGQVTGPTLGVITCPWWTPQQLLEHLATLTGYVWRIDAAKVLEMWPVGAKASGVTLSLAQGTVVSASWRRHRFEYRNRQWVLYGPSGVQAVTETLTGDGSARTFPVRYQVATRPAQVYDVGAAAWRNVGVYGVDTLFEWTWDSALGDYGGLRQLTEAPPGTPHSPLGGGAQVQVTFDSQFPNHVFVQDAGEVAARGEWNHAITAPDIVTADEAIAYGQALIRQHLPRPVMPALVTTADGLKVGETVTVDLPAIGLASETCFMQGLDTQLEPADALVVQTHTLTLLGGDEPRATDDDLWRRIITGEGASGGGVSSGGGGGGGVTTVYTGVRSHVWGATRHRGVYVAAPAWETVEGALDFVPDTDQVVTVRVEVRTDDASVSVTPRVWNVTDTVSVAAGSASTSTTWTEQLLLFAATAGKRYRLQVQGGSAAHAVYGIGLS